MIKKLIVAAAIAVASTGAFAWEGYDYETGNYIEVESGNLVRRGQTIEIYDYDSGEYRDVDVESIQRRGSTVELEVYDNEAGEYRYFDMDDN